MHNGNIFRICRALCFNAIDWRLQLRRHFMEFSSCERTAVVGADINQTLSFPVPQMGMKLSADEFLRNLVCCHRRVGWYVLVDIVAYIRCSLRIKILAQM